MVEENVDRRRALRLTLSEIDLSLTIDNQIYQDIEVLDMSTLGMGLVLNFIPHSRIGKIKFNKPSLLQNLEISIQQRYVHPFKREDGSLWHRAGYEFLFTSPNQQNSLLRWLGDELSKQLPQNERIPGGLQASGPVVRFPETAEKFEKCLGLMSPLSVAHAMIQTKFFTLFEAGEVVATIPLYPDILPFGMPAEKKFSHEISGLKSFVGRFGEIGPLYLNHERFPRESLMMEPSHRVRILLMLFQAIFAYAKGFAQLTHLVSVVPASLQEFYRMWLFEEKTLDKNGQKLMWIELKNFENRIAKERPEISWLFGQARKRGETWQGLEYSYYPTPELIKKWFFESRVFDALKYEEAKYSHFCFPELFSKQSEGGKDA